MARIILVGGGSSSGKSYITGRVIHNLGEEEVTRITIDDYYKDQAGVPMSERLKVNYDHPKAFDWQLMRAQIEALKNGEKIEKPVYDFVNHTRSGKIEEIVPKKLVVVEGIMALVDSKLRSLGDLKVFIEASAERRFLRRIIRDREERGRTYENIVSQYFSTVQPMYDEVVEPSSIYADLIINNDGVENLAVDVLTCVFKDELRKAESGIDSGVQKADEFTEERLSKVFQEEKKK
ncbi:MAG: uridine kinase [Bacilli bacterium]